MEHKFRAWSKSWQRMEYSDRYKNLSTFFYEVEQMLGEYELMYCYTGYAEGIYQGDIVKNNKNNIGVVEFDFYDDECYSTEDHIGWCINGRSITNFKGKEVIGNIYENPELLASLEK